MKRLAAPFFVAALLLFGCSDDKSPGASSSAASTALPQATGSADQALVQRIKDQLAAIAAEASGAQSKIVDVGFKDGKVLIKTTFGATPNDATAATQLCVDAQVLAGSSFDLEVLSQDGTVIAATRDKVICGPRV